MNTKTTLALFLCLLPTISFSMDKVDSKAKKPFTSLDGTQVTSMLTPRRTRVHSVSPSGENYYWPAHGRWFIDFFYQAHGGNEWQPKMKQSLYYSYLEPKRFGKSLLFLGGFFCGNQAARESVSTPWSIFWTGIGVAVPAGCIVASKLGPCIQNKDYGKSNSRALKKLAAISGAGLVSGITTTKVAPYIRPNIWQQTFEKKE